jgi:hypothetical protein
MCWLTCVGNFVSASICSLWVYQSTNCTSLRERAKTSAYLRMRNCTRPFCSTERSSPISIFVRISWTHFSANGSLVCNESLEPQLILNSSLLTLPMACMVSFLSLSSTKVSQPGMLWRVLSLF